MPTKREREYYRMGFMDGTRSKFLTGDPRATPTFERTLVEDIPMPRPKKRKLSAWQKVR